MSGYLVTPTHFEVISAGGDLAAKIEMFDGQSAVVKIDGYCTNVADWDLVSAAIRSALVAMELEV